MQSKSTPIVFFFWPPPAELISDPKRRVIWIPMWDETKRRNEQWWQKLPKNLRVVAFSKEISVRSRAAGLETLDLKLYISPADLPPAAWGNERILYYWNRTGMVGREFLSKFCRSLDVKLLIYFHRLDPRISPENDYVLPERLGKTRVMAIESINLLPKQKYIDSMGKANLFIAPRVAEGVGLSFIEALARGCAVFGYDAPTMNEYITHKINGYLFQEYVDTGWNRLRLRARNQLDSYRKRDGKLQPRHERPITDWQDWGEIKKLDLQAMGGKARQDQALGYSEWIKTIPDYASFILDW
jgi:hypothetical protein